MEVNGQGPQYLDPSLSEHHISDTLRGPRVFAAASASSRIKGDVDIFDLQALPSEHDTLKVVL